ncbi:MAG: hypothetical protein Q8Q33_02980, partial [Chlamydiota bacterium]|nr:hypothetical protein [Chlamydiota bacterium]
MFKYLFAIAFFFVNVSLYAVETEKAVLGTQSHNAYQNIHLDPAGTHAYFAHNEEYGTGVIFVCRLATGQIYPLSPITGPGGVTYNSYQPRLSPNGKFLIYMRNKKNSS